jgi:predicted ATPase/DNA-binding CsgD family transcriptional regulator
MTTRRSATRVAVPSYLTRFVGREPELTQLRQFLQSSSSRGEPERRRPTPRPRLLTLCGPGGSGKTRLASEFSHAVGRAATVGRARVDAVYWVALGPVHEASQLARAVAAACGSPVVGAARVLDNLALLLGDRRVLVVLDNCEHLLDACATLLPPLLAACPGLLVVTTSRVPIGLPGELVLPVPPLRSVSSDGTRSELAGLSEAGLLFLDRAALGFVDGQEESGGGVIEQICDRLDGLPLAIELAASWLRVLSPADLLVEIDRGIGFLSSSSPALAERHRSLHVVLDSTWLRLTGQDQRLLSALSVFVGDFSREAAEAVGGATLASLSALAEKSLIQRRPEIEHETRYHIHQLVRQHALQRLESDDPAEVQRVRSAHLQYFLGLVERAEGAWDSAAEQEWLDQLRMDQANIGASLQWALDQRRTQEALRLSAGLFAFWIYTLPPELYRGPLERALALPWDDDSDSSTRARARALNVAGYAAVLDGDYEHAVRLFEEGLRLYRRLGDTPAIAWALRGRGYAHRIQGHPDPADDLQSLALSQAAGDAAGVAWSFYDLGEVAFLRGELDEAERLLKDGLRRLEDQGIGFGAYRAVVLLGGVHVRKREWLRALRQYEEGLFRQRGTHFVARGGEILEGLAVTAAALHRPALAARLLGAGAAWRSTYGFRSDVYDIGAESTARAVRQELGAAGWSADYEAGRELSPERAMDEAAQHCQELARVAIARGARLTERQLEVLTALAQGLSNAQIAAQLVLSTRTVHAHVRSIFVALDVSSRTAAVYRAAELDLV